ncbi:ATP-dependent helicase C-terminal domain-containing protein [Streptomyces sp. I4(2020)]|uniref:ATP-dependent helicase C-terminal domain-containing protein n=1 Tax=Streptomyces sp. I4(2020) TaxID=2760981 RepID=UPI0018EE9276|nr:ATP-dependent helicase C-terminal domain-containing protein [Streptomyces sp. I4(2020)]MBJ6617063.1 ATP-dependent helicase [Streptomyces sp. I3(2020)]MBJ6628249.1 ATP-dependent helicase [Streptomyces sp. I4(2020)]
MIRHEALESLPVREALPSLAGALDAHGTSVLVAPPGTGKTTLVPLALAGLWGAGPTRRVLVAEPRRIAARAAARRMAWLLGERVGASVGFTVRGERAVGRDTRVEVVTTGVLLQRLQRDQELAGVDAVVLDECHERHLDADTAAAFLWDVRETLRPDLRLVAASATTDAEGWARLLGGAPVVEARGAAHPVDVVWAPPPRAVRPPHGLWVDPALLTHVAAVVRRALAERDGDVLVFLPGVGEISRVAGMLGGLSGVDVLQVHGRAPAAVQDAVLAPGERRRVVLATSVAESSLTVPGVRVVVDSGLAREPRVDHARGLSALATVRASRAAGRQRAGRAGREAPGAVYRCWAAAEDARLPSYPSPEIKVADLTAFALQAACWGDPDASGLALMDPPPGGAMAAARDVLTAIDAVRPDGRPTERGTRLARLGLHPRLGRALLDASPRVGAALASEVVALLSEEPPRDYGDDLPAALRTARRGGDGYAARWRTEVRRLRGALSRAEGAAGPGDAAGGGVSGSDDPVRAGAAGASAVPGHGGGSSPRGGLGGTAGTGAGASAQSDGGGVPEARGGGRRSAGRGGPIGSGVTEAQEPTAGERQTGEASGPHATAPADGGAAPGTRGGGRRSAGPRGPNGSGVTEAKEPTAGERQTGEASGPHATAPADGGGVPEARDGGRRSAGRGGVSGAAPGPGGVSDVGAAGRGGDLVAEERAVGLVVALAFPERVARADGGSYLMVGGTRAEVGAGSALRGAEWVAVAVADRPVGRGHARVLLGAAVDEDVARWAAGTLLDRREEVHWADGDVVARRVERLGAVELAARPLTDAGPAPVRAALLDGLRREGFGLLRWPAGAEVLRQRLAFLRARLGEPWPDVSDEALHARVDEWLEPELSRGRRRADLARIDAGQALARLLPWASGEAARLDELAPERITVPSGSAVRVDWSDPERPVLAVKLQEMFGLQESPTVAGVPLLVHLLSPAGRPAAVTADLASFWREGYQQVRAELRGRYPKHPWPEDPATARPTRHTNARSRG